MKTKNTIAISFLTLCLLLSPLYIKAQEYNWSAYALKGKVKSFVVWDYCVENKNAKWEETDLNKFGSYKASFNDDGNVSEVESLNILTDISDEDIDRIPTKSILRYENHKIIEEIYSPKGEPVRTISMKRLSENKWEIDFTNYNKDGIEKIVSIKNIVKDGNTEMVTIKPGPNDKDNIVTWIYEYNNNGHPTLYKYFTKNILSGYEKRIFCEKYVYLEFDEKNNWTKKLVYKCNDGKDEEEPEKILIRRLKYY